MIKRIWRITKSTWHIPVAALVGGTVARLTFADGSWWFTALIPFAVWMFVVGIVLSMDLYFDSKDHRRARLVVIKSIQGDVVGQDTGQPRRVRHRAGQDQADRRG